MRSLLTLVTREQGLTAAVTASDTASDTPAAATAADLPFLPSISHPRLLALLTLSSCVCWLEAAIPLLLLLLLSVIVSVDTL